MTDTSNEEAPKGIILNRRVYDLLKDVDMLILPAIGTAYATLATIWHWHYAAQVVGSVAVFVVFLGVLLKISSVQYKAEAKVAVAKEEVAAVYQTPAGANVVSTSPPETTPSEFSQ
jgi:Putative phage holin Dp-1